MLQAIAAGRADGVAENGSSVAPTADAHPLHTAVPSP